MLIKFSFVIHSVETVSKHRATSRRHLKNDWEDVSLPLDNNDNYQRYATWAKSLIERSIFAVISLAYTDLFCDFFFSEQHGILLCQRTDKLALEGRALNFLLWIYNIKTPLKKTNSHSWL